MLRRAPALRHAGVVFIRKTATRARARGGSYTSFRLVESVRSGSQVSQRTLLNLGSGFAVPPERWPELVLLVESLRSGQAYLLEPDPALLGEAERIAEALRLRGLDAPAEQAVAVHLDSLEHSRVRSVGCERLALHALDQLGLQAALRAQGVSARDATVAAALVVARMVHPSSEHAAHAWLAGSSATLELLGLERAKPLSLSKLYRTSDLLWKHREALETAFAQRERSLFDTPAAIVFYDLTNVHYHGRPGGDMQFGRSKQKRSDCPLATLALALDGAGFPRCSEVLKGNVSEPGTLQAAIERLEAQRGAGPLPTVVMDAGLSTEANLAWLRARGYPWITVQRGRAPRPDSAPDAAFATRAGHPVQAWRVDSEGDETHLRVWSQQRQQKDEAIVVRRRERFEAEVRALHAGLARKGCTKRYDKVLERLGRLKERYRQVAGQYDIAVERGSGQGRAAQLATAIRIEPNGKHPARDAQAGMYVLRTSHTQWGPERVVQTYWQLAEIEAAFRSLKGEAGLRPIFHVKPSRIRAHLFLAVLAYHGVHLLRKRLAQAGLRSSWETIRRQLAGWVRLTTSLRAADGRWIQCRQDSRPDAKAAELAQAIGLAPGLHRMRTSHAADATPSPSSTQ